MAFELDKIRNFCIIAHIDHGKSTLADRLLELTRSVAQRDMEEQLLDSMDLERERGITIKAHAVTLYYTAADGNEYELNLIDTPGHVDFHYEVSRSLAACEGAILVVDASQGIEAQTLANTYLAVDHNLEIVPVINKIDLPAADPDRIIAEIEDVIGIPAEGAPKISAKSGLNVEQVLEKIITDIPAPEGDRDAPLKALIFDSYYDAYRGVIVFFRVVSGKLKTGDAVKMMATGAEMEIVELGRKRATSLEACDCLEAGEVGYLAASIKSVRDARVGDTITHRDRPAAEPLEGYRKGQPGCFSAEYILPTAQNIPILRMRSKSCSLTTRRLCLKRKPRERLASASDAVSWGCFIWKLLRNVLSVNIILTLSPQHRALFINLSFPMAVLLTFQTPPTTPTLQRLFQQWSRLQRCTFTVPLNLSVQLCSFVRNAAVITKI